MTETRYPECGVAWDYIGFDGRLDENDLRIGHVRIVGGRALYEAVIYYDETPGDNVKLVRLVADGVAIRQVERYVDPDTPLEFVLDAASTPVFM
jgi:hypothetical protein